MTDRRGLRALCVFSLLAGAVTLASPASARERSEDQFDLKPAGLDDPITAPTIDFAPLGITPGCDAEFGAIAEAAAITAAVESRLDQMSSAVESVVARSTDPVDPGPTDAPATERIDAVVELDALARQAAGPADVAARAVDAARAGAAGVSCAALVTDANAALADSQQHFRDGRKILSAVESFTTTGTQMTIGYCDTAAGSRMGGRSLAGAIREPSQVLEPANGTFVGTSAADGVYSGTADVYDDGGASSVTVAAHIDDDRAGGPVDLWSHLGIVRVIWSGIEIPRAYQPMCYADDPGQPNEAPTVGYIDTREQSGPNRPSGIDPAQAIPFAVGSVSLLPMATIEVSDIDLGAERNDEPNNPFDDVDIQSTEHTLFVGEAPRPVGTQAPGDVGLRIDDGLLRHVEDWADVQLTNLGNQLVTQLSALSRVDHATISNVNVDIDLDDMVVLPSGGLDTDESMLTLRGSVDQIFVKLQKQNGKDCGIMTVGPISVEAKFTFDRSADGQNVLPRLMNAPVLDLGDLVLDQQHGWIGCGVAMLSGVGDVRDVLTQAFGSGLAGAGSGCSFWDYALGGLMLVGGVALAALSAGIAAGAGVALAAAGANIVATCAFGIPANFPSLFGLIWQVITGVDITVDLGTVDLTALVNGAIASVSDVSISSLLSGTGGPAAALTLIDTCTGQGCDGGDILITPEGIEIVADANLRVTSGGGGVDLPVTYNMPADVPDLFGGYNDMLNVRDVVARTTSLANQPIDLTLALGTDSLNATFASLVAGGALDKAHGDPDCNGNPVQQTFGAFTYDISTTAPALVGAAPYTDPNTGEVLPLSLGFHSLLIDVHDTADTLVVSAYVDFNGGVGFDFDVASGVLTPIIDVDPATLRVNYRDTAGNPAFAPFIISLLANQLQTALPAAVANLVGGVCGIKPFDLDSAISSLTNGSGQQLIDFDYNIWVEGFEGGVAIYADVLAPFSVTALLQSSDYTTGSTTTTASVNFGNSANTEFRWQHVLTDDFGNMIQSTPWSPWTLADDNNSFTFSLPAPLPDADQFPFAEIRVEARDSFGRVGAASTYVSFYVPCANGGGGGTFCV